MHFPRHWFLAEQGNASAWGWSDESLAQAEVHARSRLARILEWLRQHGGRPAQRYGYADRPLREPVLKEFRGPDGTLYAAITRNSYGCLVLNAARLMFVDVDAPEAKESGFLAGLFGFRRPDKNRNPDVFETALLEKVRGWVATRADWAWRVYRTKAGMRLMATHAPFAPDHAMCQSAFEVFEADPLYRQLCATQKCFRARLTPKPWRCAAGKPQVRWPWASEKAETRFRKWEAQYNQASARHATCELVGQFGQTQFHPALREFVAYHDEATKAGSGLPLA